MADIFDRIHEEAQGPIPADAPGQVAPTKHTHNFSVSQWKKVNPGGDTVEARKEAMRQGYKVVG